MNKTVFRQESFDKFDKEERPYNNEAYTDTMTAKEQEAFYKSFGQDVPATPSSLEQAKENLAEKERTLYKDK